VLFLTARLSVKSDLDHFAIGEFLLKLSRGATCFQILQIQANDAGLRIRRDAREQSADLGLLAHKAECLSPRSSLFLPSSDLRHTGFA